MKLFTILTFVAAASAIQCGSNMYSDEQVKAADAAVCTHVKAHTQVGKYPHQYNNYEKFQIRGLKGPFYEFPLLKSGIYKGGKLSILCRLSGGLKKKKKPIRSD